jgi:hypothetical protein
MADHQAFQGGLEFRRPQPQALGRANAQDRRQFRPIPQRHPSRRLGGSASSQRKKLGLFVEVVDENRPAVGWHDCRSTVFRPISSIRRPASAALADAGQPQGQQEKSIAHRAVPPSDALADDLANLKALLPFKEADATSSLEPVPGLPAASMDRSNNPDKMTASKRGIFLAPAMLCAASFAAISSAWSHARSCRRQYCFSPATAPLAGQWRRRTVNSARFGHRTDSRAHHTDRLIAHHITSHDGSTGFRTSAAA